MVSPFKQKRRSRHRKGVSTVEFAVMAPVLVLLVFGSIESSHAIQVKQGLTVVAYEASLVATTQSSTEEQMLTRARQIAEAFQIKDIKVETVPRLTSDLPAGTTVTVTVSAPMRSNRIGPSFFYFDRTLAVRASMVRL